MQKSCSSAKVRDLMKTSKAVLLSVRPENSLTSCSPSIGMKREQVYITNVVKHRPPGNRDPLPSEISACSFWLDRQLELIHPTMIVTLGSHSMARYFPGQVHKQNPWHRPKNVTE